MKILHTISSIDLSGGGPSKSVSELALNQAMQGHMVTICTYSSTNPYLKNSLHPNLSLHFVPSNMFKSDLTRLLHKNKFDFIHGHGIWQMPVHQMAKIAQKNNLPYIITPRGMLQPFALNIGKWKKTLALALYQRKDLARASCIHATAKEEAINISQLGFKNPIAVIPNGINISDFLVERKSTNMEKFTLLFLSRIHPIKGIENLIEAWHQIDEGKRKYWRIEIVGNGNTNYITLIQKLIETKGLLKEIKIVGPKFGEEKLKTYLKANLFVLPTFSENFGMVVSEALACGLPVITTKGAPWQELNTYNAGWWIDIGVQPLVQALQKAMELSEEQRLEMGRNGRRLVEEKYSIEAVSEKMIELYKWILNGGEMPKFVV